MIAPSLGEPSQTAWDIYLFYPAGHRWNERLEPVAWAHQLSGVWQDHYHYGEDLEIELRTMAGRLLATWPRSSP